MAFTGQPTALDAIGLLPTIPLTLAKCTELYQSPPHSN
jgi:hypothetical protein